MNTIKINKTELLNRIRENRDKHRAIFEDALKGYREAAIKELDQALDDAKNGRKIMRSLKLVEPQDHTDDYNAIIDMLEMSVDDEIEISQDQFRCYVRDEWAWKGQFLLANSSYSALALE